MYIMLQSKSKTDCDSCYNSIWEEWQHQLHTFLHSSDRLNQGHVPVLPLIPWTTL